MNHVDRVDTEWTALICCRVSDRSQLRGSGLDSQEHRCRKHAEINGYRVEEVFLESMSDGYALTERPTIRSLLAHVDANRHSGKNYVAIFDDHKRFARQTENHLLLRRMLRERGVRVEFLNFTLDETPENRFSETMFAAQAQLEREQNARQNRERRRARLEKGFHVTRAPIGYLYEKSPRGGKVLVPDEMIAPIIREAIEGFAEGRFASQAEVKRYLESRPELPIRRNSNGEIAPQRVVEILRHHIYAGLVSAPYLGVSLRKGQHAAIISFETHETVLARLAAGVYAPTRKDITEDFVLRGAVVCDCCKTPLTAGWSKGKCKKYPYYFCREKGCAVYGKTIPRALIESRFAALLAEIQPKPNVAGIAKEIFQEAWTQRVAQIEHASRKFADEADRLEKEIGRLVDCILSANSPRVISAYESRIEELERKKLLAQERASKTPRVEGRFGELFEHALNVLSNPLKAWKTGCFELQRPLLRMAFSEHLEYCRENGFRTPKTTLPFKVLGLFCGQEMRMVPLE
ncbi:recombinase family protein [Maricaulis sp. W15]|uniref:recombinase family protein n=1 Tax=Maricaulis sp. W15 TaxID=1772333 RepID=UPI000948A49B|nr:recombinase family protein [Maricaulis sp. W15]